jgi:hypothetical protein
MGPKALNLHKYIYIYICIYICIYINGPLKAYIFVCMIMGMCCAWSCHVPYGHECICMFVGINTWNMHVYIFIFIYTYIYIYIYVCIYIYTYTYVFRVVLACFLLRLKPCYKDAPWNSKQMWTSSIENGALEGLPKAIKSLV